MDFFPDFEATRTYTIPTQTISVDPPGGTGAPGGPKHSHLPLPTFPIPEATARHIHATHVGHMALWVFFALFAVAFVAVGVLSLRVERRSRFFHNIAALVFAISAVTYLALSTGLGIQHLPTNHHGRASGHHHGDGAVLLFRDQYWLRYVDWLLTTPLILIAVSFLAGLSAYTTVFIAVADIFVIVLGALAAVHPGRYHDDIKAKWAFLVLSAIAFLTTFGTLLSAGRKAVQLRTRRNRGIFWLLAIGTAVTWTAYPIIFGLSEGGNRISVNAEIIAYGIMDVVAKIGLLSFLILIHKHDEDNFLLPEWWVTPRAGLGLDGTGNYGAIRVDE
ncbi:hypothetical protein Q5752_004885 [Cryptotrichosporon argae]